MKQKYLNERLIAIDNFERRLIAFMLLVVFTGYYVAAELAKTEARKNHRSRTSRSANKKGRSRRYDEYYGLVVE